MDPGSDAVTEVITVDVPGGALAVEHVTAGTGPVLAVHGISSQRKLWNWLRAERPDLSLIAPDLRGRGDSVAVSGPSSVAGQIPVPARLLTAEWSTGRGSPPAYPAP